MTALSRGELPRLLDRFDPAVRLLLLAGADESQTAALARQARAALADPADPMSVVDLAPADLAAAPGRLADEAASQPLFGGRLLVRVSQATDAVAEAVRLLLDAPVAGNPVLMLAGDLPRTSTLRKLAEAHPAARVHLSWPLDGRGLDRWLAEAARAEGLVARPAALELLVAAAGPDTGVLAQELSKFALYLDAAPGRPARLEPEHVAALVAGLSDEDPGALVAAVTAGDGTRAAAELAALDHGGASAIPALRALARRLGQLAQARRHLDAGASPAEAVAAVRPPLFWRDRAGFEAAVRAWPADRLARAMLACLAAERAIKSPRAAGDTLGWQAIARIAPRSPGRAALGGRARGG